MKTADIALCLSLEAMRGELAAFDPRLQRARPHPGQMKVARNILRILDGTQRCAEAAPPRDVVFPEENRAPGTPASAARAGCLFPALRTPGPRPGQ